MTETLTLPASVATRPSLFRGLNYYTEAEADCFFGRDREKEHLYQLIKYNVLTLVFGKSGTGKTSLLNAGVFPALREDDCLPFPIRLKFGDDSPPLKEQVVQVLTQKIEQDGFIIRSFEPDDTLWEFFHREDLWKVITPVLIFDQFEEIFTLLAAQSPKTAELTALFTELADLIENTIPEPIKEAYLRNNEPIPFNHKRQRAKVVFSFREDFLPEMESITAFIPSIRNSRFRLLPMTARQAYEVITKTWRNTIQAAEARKLVYYLTNNDEAGNEELTFQLDTMALFEIEPSLLSQVCSYLEAKRVEEDLDKISAEFLSKYPKETILHSIYYDAVQAAGSTIPISEEPDEDKVKRLQIFLEDNLINEEGYRIKYDKKEIHPALLPGIAVLKSHYFIREEEESVELSHDVVGNIVRIDRDERRKNEADAEAKARARRRSIRILVAAGAVVVLAAIAAGYFVSQAANAKVNADKVNKAVEKAYKKLDVLNDSINDLQHKKLIDIDTTKRVIAFLMGLTDSLNRQNDTIVEQNRILTDTLNHYKIENLVIIKKIVENAFEISGLQAKSNTYSDSLKRIKRTIYENGNQFRSYSTHLDAIFRSRDEKNTPELYYRVGVLKANYDSFKQRLNYDTTGQKLL